MAISNVKKLKKVATVPSPSDFDSLPYPQYFCIKMTAKDVKEITYMP